MNSIYDDNYRIDNVILRKVMKYYQSCVISLPFLDSFCDINIKENDDQMKFDYAELVLDSIDYNETGIRDVIKCMIDFVKCQDNLLFMPIVTIFNDKIENLKSGHYCLDIQNEMFIRYIDLSDEYAQYIQRKANSSFSITIFLNIKKAISIFNEMGFIQSVLQIGELINYMKIKLPNYNISDRLNVSQQVLTHQLKINNTEMLMISNLLFSTY